MATVNEYEALSQAVYGDSNESILDNMPNWTQIDITGYGKYYTNSDGFAAAVYYNQSTNEIVLAIRGTQPTDLNDLFADGAILNQQDFSQADTVNNFYKYITNK